MKTGPVILAYHAIGDCPGAEDFGNLFVPRDAFEEQMAYLASKKEVITLEEAVSGSAPAGSVAITFDDGYRNVLTQAAPILKRHGFPATVFVPTGWIGGRNEWDRPLPVCDVQLMNESELKAVIELGVTPESHGHDHIDMGAATFEEVQRDLKMSLDVLSAITGWRPRYLAYPFGRESADARRAARSIGLEAAFTIDAPDDGILARERVQITPLDGPRGFAFKVSGRYLRLRYDPVLSRAYRLIKPLVRRG